MTEIIPAVQALSRSEKFFLAQMLLEELANGELPAALQSGHVFPIDTPAYAPGAAAQLASLLADEGRDS